MLTSVSRIPPWLLQDGDFGVGIHLAFKTSQASSDRGPTPRKKPARAACGSLTALLAPAALRAPWPLGAGVSDQESHLSHASVATD